MVDIVRRLISKHVHGMAQGFDNLLLDDRLFRRLRSTKAKLSKALSRNIISAKKNHSKLTVVSPVPPMQNAMDKLLKFWSSFQIDICHILQKINLLKESKKIASILLYFKKSSISFC
jgi:hypothetical protein